MSQGRDDSIPSELDPETVLGPAAEAIPILGAAAYELTRDTTAPPALRVARVVVKTTAGTAAASFGAAEGAAIGTAICPGLGTLVGGVFGWFAGYTAIATRVDAVTGD